MNEKELRKYLKKHVIPVMVEAQDMADKVGRTELGTRLYARRLGLELILKKPVRDL